MKNELIVGINNGGSGDNLIVGRREDGVILVNDKVKPKEPLPANVMEQLPIRLETFRQWWAQQTELTQNGKVCAVVSRGPTLKPDINGQPYDFGIYEITPSVIQAINSNHLFTTHASQIGPLIASEFAAEHGARAIFVDPISGQRLPASWEITGIPEVKRRPLGHWLNIHYVLHHLYGASWTDQNIVICHFGTGFTIAAFVKGKLVNVNDANAAGPFSDTRAGEMPSEPFMDWVAAREGSLQDAKDFIQSRCGLAGHLGVKSLEEALALVEQGDDQAILVYQSMVVRVAEEIARRFSNIWTSSAGLVDKLVFTGGMANSQKFINDIQRSLIWLFGRNLDEAREVMDLKISVLPGSFEAKAMIRAAHQILDQSAKVISYGPLPS